MKTERSSAVVLIEQTGSPDVLRYQTVTLPEPGETEVLIAQKSIGVNFVDIFFRNGTFPMDTYPAPVGSEAAGIIEAVGPGVKDFVIGDRVAYPFAMGAYAESRIIPASSLFKLPDDITFDQAAAVLVKGLTAHMLLKQSYCVKSGDIVLIHAMTGGVGTLLSDWARALGAIVIGTVGGAAKKELALTRGFEHVVNLQSEDFADVVNKVTQGKGLDAVYDGTGEATFQKSVDLIKAGGSAVLYGWPSGMPTIYTELMEQKNIHYANPALYQYLQDQEKITLAVTEVFNLLRKGILNVQNTSIYALADAGKAHADLESRKTTGSIILRP
ncbi:quinone oxidoreductase family protein [Mucilaginibacter polytrichastri]|uniref:Quinone oxidoreductase n=1 Tax=Mucilaginibacter polytrichastri TaxID=1302689 RepID=A0A1Q6A6L8_9SPHI|nr:quinone oxidoreductase [Mucilaginibacter polytrichastri]OKS89632.1 Quinone oxidoreductase [Mucilaginibacter polytrichastri]SFT24587.1 NADPH2:quinone reductase [Mucilaginibacter polytrichastri]